MPSSLQEKPQGADPLYFLLEQVQVQVESQVPRVQQPPGPQQVEEASQQVQQVVGVFLVVIVFFLLSVYLPLMKAAMAPRASGLTLQ